MRAFVYILRCSDGSLYTGYTLDLDRRVRQHQSGNGGRYTRTHLPVVLAYAELCRSRRAAMLREIVIKRLPRKSKLRLTETDWRKPLERGVRKMGREPGTAAGGGPSHAAGRRARTGRRKAKNIGDDSPTA